MPKQRTHAGERRVKSTRLSERLLVVASSVLVAAALSAPLAQAQKLPELEVTATNPASTQQVPANSTTPFVIGHEDGGITTAIDLTTRLSSTVTAAIDPSEEVALYTEPGCVGEPTASGTLNEFEGVGIHVEVDPDSATSFYARHFDPGEANEPSNCSKKGFIYWESSTVGTPPVEPPAEEASVEQRPGTSNPPVAPHLRTQPSSRANDNSPRISGSAPGAERVKIFTNTSCSGSPLANISAGELGSGIAMQVSDNSVTDFAGISVANGKQSFCSPPATYIEDSTPPRTRITMGPGTKTRRHKAVFRFADTSGDTSGVQFKCKVDHGNWKSCHSPLKLRHLGFHRYVLRVRGTDAIGNAETKPAKRSFKVIH
jgi:hypothetical protein